MNKSALRDAIVAQLRRDFALQVGAAQLARDEAISEESRAESKYDTHSQEAAYLAEGQARLAAEVEESIAQFMALPLPPLAANDAIGVGALVELRPTSDAIATTTAQWYFVGPRAGGTAIALEEKTVLVVTPQSPLGRQLLGKHVGDPVEAPGRGKPALQRIASIA